MAPTCKNCNKTVKDSHNLTCKNCKHTYHLDCTKVSTQRFYLMTLENKCNWKCNTCWKKIRAEANNQAETPCNVTHQRPKYKVNVSIENSFESLSNTLSDDDDDFSLTMENRLNRSCPDVTIEHASEDIEAIKSKLEVLEEKLKTAENEIENLLSENYAQSKVIEEYKKKVKTLTDICKSDTKKRNKRTSLNKTKLNFTCEESCSKTNLVAEKMDTEHSDKGSNTQNTQTEQQRSLRSFALKNSVEEPETSTLKKENIDQTDIHRVLIFADEQGRGLCRQLSNLLGSKYRVCSDRKPGATTDKILENMKTQCFDYGGVWSLRNVSISVPRAVLSGEGQSAVLRCSYDLEGAALYSIRWYRAENEFYRYVPREMPPTMVFPLPGASVDLAQSDHQQVRIVNMNRRLSGDYQCEVSADAPLFHTDIRSAPLTVVDPPFRSPQITISQRSYSRGDALRANCSVDEAYPAPNITWFLDGQKIAETVSWKSSDLDFKERAAFSQIEISILEAEHFKMGITYTSSSLNRVYHDHYVYDQVIDNEDRELLRYTLVPPPSGQFNLMCVANIYGIYERKSDPIYVKEDSPQPASVTGEDSSGTALLCNATLTLLSVCIALLQGAQGTQGAL